MQLRVGAGVGAGAAFVEQRRSAAAIVVVVVVVIRCRIIARAVGIAVCLFYYYAVMRIACVPLFVSPAAADLPIYNVQLLSCSVVQCHFCCLSLLRLLLLCELRMVVLRMVGRTAA